MNEHAAADPVLSRIEHLAGLMMELETILQSLVLNDSMMIDALAHLLGTQQAMHTRSEESLADLTAEIRGMGIELALLKQPAQSARPAVSCGPSAMQEPEIALLAYLQPFMPTPKLIDVGANVGDLASMLVDSGYEVFAFEPFSSSFAALDAKAATHAGLHAFRCALGAADGTADLHVAADSSADRSWNTSLFHSLVPHPMLSDLRFADAQRVQVRSIGSLMQDGTIPRDASVLKIDTEGNDIEVIRGLGDASFSVLLTEFWDAKHPFGIAGHGDLSTLVGEMRARGYPSHIVFYRVDPTGQSGFYCNGRATIAQSWGNVVFFADHALFGRAVRWCEDRLPRAS